jgi:two-component system, OmpR family, response regulator VanR
MSIAKRILIAEDEKPLAHALELKLTREGCTVKVVENGQEALDVLETEEFDVMLLDMMMPTMDGFQVLEHINEREKKPIVFVLSNLSLHDDQQRVLGMGAKKYFIKSETSLATIVQEIKSA